MGLVFGYFWIFFLTSLVLVLQKDYLYENGIEFHKIVIGATVSLPCLCLPINREPLGCPCFSKRCVLKGFVISHLHLLWLVVLIFWVESSSYLGGPIFIFWVGSFSFFGWGHLHSGLGSSSFFGWGHLHFLIKKPIPFHRVCHHILLF